VSLAPRAGGGAPAQVADAAEYEPRIARRKRFGKVFLAACIAATLVGLVALVVLLVDIAADGFAFLSWNFLTGKPSRFADRAGLGPAFVGTLWVLGVTAVVSFPLGVATAIWLEEYAPDNRWKRLVQINIANLAGVPSVVYGILGLAVFVRWMQLGRSVAAGGLTLSLLILPVIIIAAQEAIRAVPNSIRLGAYGLGATKWQTVRHHVFPMALPGILTGTILALSRAIGETAPLIMIGALLFVPFVPKGLLDTFTVIPIQVYNWVSRPQPDFHSLAASGILVLLAVLLTMNTVAILLRNKYTRDDS
jgi:phosphate transport system permease protein